MIIPKAIITNRIPKVLKMMVGAGLPETGMVGWIVG